jgi:hypothetical protein
MVVIVRAFPLSIIASPVFPPTHLIPEGSARIDTHLTRDRLLEGYATRHAGSESLPDHSRGSYRVKDKHLVRQPWHNGKM